MAQSDGIRLGNERLRLRNEDVSHGGGGLLLRKEYAMFAAQQLFLSSDGGRPGSERLRVADGQGR
jgi:hypothetical protein